MHLGTVSGLAFSPDSRFLASSDAEGTIKLWDLAQGKEEWHIPLRGGVYGFLDDRDKLVTAFAPSNLAIWDVKGRRQIATYQLSDSNKGSLGPDNAEIGTIVRFSSDGKFLAAGSRVGAVKIYNLSTGATQLIWDQDKRQVIQNQFGILEKRFDVGYLSFDAKAEWLTVGYWDGLLYKYKVECR